MEQKKAKQWTSEDLERLNVLVQPAWIYWCQNQRLLWANAAALQYFNRSLDVFTSFSFLRISPDELPAFTTLNRLLQDEVEVAGAEQVVAGFGHSVLPGVPPHFASSRSEFLYKPVTLLFPGASEAIRCTLIQIAKSPSNGASARIVALKSHASSTVTTNDGRLNGLTASSSASLVSNLLELFDGILQGREVAMENVEALQASLLKGDIISQPGRIEEELVSKEALDQDVGLNLLQLLGSRTAGAKYLNLPSAFDSDIGSSAVNVQRLSPTRGDGGSSSPRIERVASGSLNGESADGEVVAASLIPAMEAVLSTVDDWRFDAFKLAEVTQGHPLSALGFWLMKRHDIVARFSLDATKLARFLRRIEDGYPDNPYHNKTHAAHVLQGMHVLLTRGGLQRRLGEELSGFAGYMAAIMHDYEHRGLNNDFLVRVGDELALTYNDTAPMENHHVAASFRLLRHKDFNFMRKMPRDKWVRLRRLLIETVLATDMKQHFNILSKFQAKLQVKLRGTSFSPVNLSSSGSSGHAAADSPLLDEAQVLTEDDADKSLILQVALKIADVGHLAAPWEVHHRWVSGLEEEFFRQGDKEKAMHMMVSPLMDRAKDGITKSQVGFFDIVALPLFYSWSAVFHNALPLLRAVEDNCNRWRSLEAGRMQQSAASAAAAAAGRTSP